MGTLRSLGYAVAGFLAGWAPLPGVAVGELLHAARGRQRGGEDAELVRRALLQSNGVNMDELAERLGVKYYRLRMEFNNSCRNSKLRAAIAEAAGVTYSEMWGQRGPRSTWKPLALGVLAQRLGRGQVLPLLAQVEVSMRRPR